MPKLFAWKHDHAYVSDHRDLAEYQLTAAKSSDGSSRISCDILHDVFNDFDCQGVYDYESIESLGLSGSI